MCSGAVAILNLADPERWILEQYLPDVGGRTLGGKGHADIVRCSHLDLQVSWCRYELTSVIRVALTVSWKLQTSVVVTGGEDGRICLWAL